MQTPEEVAKRATHLLEKLFCATLNNLAAHGKEWFWERGSPMDQAERFLLQQGRRLTQSVPASFEDVPLGCVPLRCVQCDRNVTHLVRTDPYNGCPGCGSMTVS